jgi:thiol-disulfide isomerase/thioredoxin
MRTSTFLLAIVFLTSCTDAPRRDATHLSATQPVEIIDAVWTPTALNRADRLRQSRAEPRKSAFELPLLRAYNSKRGLVFDSHGEQVDDSLGDKLEDAIGSHWEIDGVDFAQAVGALELRDGRPLIDVIATSDAPVVFDYRSGECMHCKTIDDKLIDWARSSENGPVRIVRVEDRGIRGFIQKRQAEGRSAQGASN